MYKSTNSFSIRGKRVVLWAHSSLGRAPALQAGGSRFDPDWVHQGPTISRQTSRLEVETRAPATYEMTIGKSTFGAYGSTLHPCYAELAQLGERLPYKQDVGGSSPSFRTIFTEGYYESSLCLQIL